MGFKAKETIIHVRKGSVIFMRILCRSVPDHPFICVFVAYLFILYRYFPTLFAFVISSSPVVICAALLLGILLIYGDTNIPESEIISTTARPRSIVKSICPEDNNVSVDAHARSKKEVESNDDHDSSSELDGEVNSSPDASVTDIIPSPDELHPLLDSGVPEASLRSVDDSEQESDDDSIDEELDNQEDEEEEEDAHEEKDDVNEEVLKWTADDQKNLIDLGTSELERNRRLENLIAKRTARKFLSFHEKSLIDLDINDPMPSTENNLQLNVQVPPIFAPRRNPFDVPFEDESYTCIPPIPGSAPSILQPRQNPFDTSLNQGEENQNLFFARNEFFSTGASSSSDMKHDVQNSVMKPYFVAEKKVSFDGVSTEKAYSTVSSEDESESTVSDTEQEVHDELVEPEIHNVNHVAVLGNQYDGTLEIDSQSSEIDSVVDSNDQIGTDENIQDSGLNAANDNAVEIEIRHGEYNGHDTGDGDLDELDGESYDDTSPSSSEAYDNQSTISVQDSNKSEEEQDNNSVIFPDEPIQSVSGDDGHIPEPVYDSSPTAAEKVTIEDPLLFADKEDSTFEDSLTSLQRQSHDGEVSSEEQHHESNNENDYKATSSLSSVDENELRSREVTEIKEKDIFRISIPRTNEHEHIPSPVMPKRFGIARRLSLCSNDSLSNLELPPIPEEQSEYSKPDENSTGQNVSTEEDSNVAIYKDDEESEASSSSSVNLEKVRNISKFW